MGLAHRIAVAALALFALSGGAASAAWSPPRTLASLDGYAPAAAVSADGRALVAMSDYDSAGSRIVVAARGRGGDWSATRTVRTSRHELFEPAVAFDTDGDARLAWLRAPRIDQVQILESRRLRRDGTLSAVQAVSSDGVRAMFPSVIAGPRGRTMVAWEQGDYDLFAAEARGGAFGEPVPVFTARQFAYRIAYAPDGTAIAVSQAFGAGGVRVSLRPPGGAWGEPQVLSGPRTAREPALAIATDGTVAVAWAQNTDAGYRIQYALRPPGGQFSRPVTAGEGRGPAVAFGTDGTLLVAWVGATRSDWVLRGSEIRLAAAARGGQLGRAARIGGSGVRILAAPTLLTDRQGDALLTWTQRGRSAQLMSVTRTRSGRFSSPEPVGPGAYHVEVVANTGGDALAVWAATAGRGPSARALVQVAERRF